MNTNDYEFDVAFSFLADDEGIAISIADELRDRYSVFIYSERQKELAGKDGLVQFSEVFGKKARVCVVLYRLGWGQTKWTRIEETAIKERAFEHGWDFLLIIALESCATPAWLPKTKIWLGLERFGIQGAAGVIDARVQETGGKSREETPREKATRLARKAKIQEEHKAYLTSPEGLAAAHNSLESLFEHLREEVEAITSLPDSPDIRFIQTKPNECCIRSEQANVMFLWNQQFQNSLRQSSLIVREFQYAYWGDDAREVRMYFVLDDAGLPSWRDEKNLQRPLGAVQLADYYMKRLLQRYYGETTADG
jgi:hypothetical protein